MNRVTANLLIVLAFLLLALAYRLKQKGNNCSQSKARPRAGRVRRLFGGTAHRRPGPGRLERLWLELTIIFTSARWGVLGV